MNKRDEKQVKAYFLGELADENAEQIEMRFFDDGDFAGQALGVEEELIEAYLDGNLTDEECRRFEGNYLVTGARQMRLEFVRNLKSGKLADTKQPAPLAALPKSKKPLFAGGASDWWNRFWSPQLKIGFAFGCGLLLLVLCAGVFRFFTHPTATSVERSDRGGSAASETSIASSSPSVNLPPQSIAQTAGSPEIKSVSGEQSKSANPTGKENIGKKKAEPANLNEKPEKQKNEIKQTPAAILGTTLLPGILRNDTTKSQYVFYSPNDKTTVINLTGVEIQRSRVIVELQSAESEVLWQKSDLKVQSNGKGKRMVSIPIPRNVLSERTFVVVLYEDREPIAEYVFQAKSK